VTWRTRSFGAFAFLAALLLPLCLTPARSQELASEASARPQILVLLRLAPQRYRPGSNYAGGYGADQLRSARQRLANRVARTHNLTLVDQWPMPLLGLDCFIMAVAPGQTAEAAAAEVSRDAGVAFSQPMNQFRAQGYPAAADPLLPAQPALRQWRLNDLHQMATGKGVRVAVIDSKVDARHPDLAGQVVVAEDFVPAHPTAAEAHGTGVAGVIAAKADNGIGIAGIAPQARLLSLRACWQAPGASGTVCDSLSLAKALYYAIEHNAQVINLSLSGPQDPLLTRLLDVGLSRRMVIVAAYDRSLPGGGFPANVRGVVAVSDGPLAASAGAIYYAPGRDIPTTQPGGRWYLVNGSSYSAAHVSGLIALLRQRAAWAGPATAIVSERPGGGSIDACATLVRAFGPCDCACASPAVVADRRH
jgi:subtilisin family serine protease